MLLNSRFDLLSVHESIINGRVCDLSIAFTGCLLCRCKALCYVYNGHEPHCDRNILKSGYKTELDTNSKHT